MTRELINSAIINNVKSIIHLPFDNQILVELCKAASYDERRGVALLTATPSHPLWNRGEYENVEDWSLEKQLTYLIVHGFRPEALFNYAGADSSENPNTDLFEQEYDVIVRAIVSMKEPIPPIIEWNKAWDVYEHESSNGQVTVRLDTVIRLKANNKQEALERAKISPPPLGVDLEMDVNFWVDTDQEEDVVEVKA